MAEEELYAILNDDNKEYFRKKFRQMSEAAEALSTENDKLKEDVRFLLTDLGKTKRCLEELKVKSEQKRADLQSKLAKDLGGSKSPDSLVESPDIDKVFAIPSPITSMSPSIFSSPSTNNTSTDLVSLVEKQKSRIARLEAEMAETRKIIKGITGTKNGQNLVSSELEETLDETLSKLGTFYQMWEKTKTYNSSQKSEEVAKMQEHSQLPPLIENYNDLIGEVEEKIQVGTVKIDEINEQRKQVMKINQKRENQIFDLQLKIDLMNSNMEQLETQIVEVERAVIVIQFYDSVLEKKITKFNNELDKAESKLVEEKVSHQKQLSFIQNHKRQLESELEPNNTKLQKRRSRENFYLDGVETQTLEEFMLELENNPNLINQDSFRIPMEPEKTDLRKKLSQTRKVLETITASHLKGKKQTNK